MPKKTEELDASVGLPISGLSFGKAKPPAVFWTFVEKYDRPDAILFYVYRLWPKIDRQLVGIKHSYIAKLTVLSSKILLREWGTGKYQVRMVDSSVGKGSEVARTVVDLEDPDYPPVLDVNEVVRGVEANAGYLEGLRNRGLLPEQKEDSMQNTNGAAATAVAEMAAITKAALAPKGAAEGSTIKDMIAVAQALKPKEQDNKLLELLLTQQTTLITAMMNQKSQPAAAAPAVDPIEQISQTVSLIDKLRGSGGGGGESSSWVGDLIKALPVVVSSFSDSLRSIAVLRGGENQVAVSAAPGPAVAALPVHNPPPVQEDSFMGVSILRLTAVGRKALSAFGRGVAGDDFAHSLCSLEEDGEQVFDLLFQLGSAGIVDALRTLPAWPSMAARETEILAWLDSFLSYGKADDEGDVAA